LRLCTETIAPKALRTLLGIYPLFKSDRLSVNTELTLYKAFIRSIIYQGSHRLAICTWRSKFRAYTISLQNYAGSSDSKSRKCKCSPH